MNLGGISDQIQLQGKRNNESLEGRKIMKEMEIEG